ncbi:mitotic spindle checkpoint protein MAD1-like [Panicum miliaceum]|uniref:Mitotic spindle checkpoint protein MAD1-like n=1 Tax=Panicum miliaceum TaxID=4540 RepID=A0A3L6STD4_PANMI|nr:mitotic spindle checkpoint protein MAD1-like [Panicum miliaceum]
MAGNPGAGGGAKVVVEAAAAAVAQAERRVALGDLTNVVSGGLRLGGVLTEKEVDEATKLKPCSTSAEWLKEKLLEKQGHRERAEMELPKLKKTEAKADIEFGSCKVLLSDKPDVSPYGDVHQKQALTNLNEIDEATLAKDSAESGTGELAAVSKERDKLMKDQAMRTKQETRNADDTSLKDMLSGLNGMDKIFIALERTMDELISRQQDERIFNERLSIERNKVQSLEQEIDQLRSQVALLQSKLDHRDNSASSTKVPCAVDTLSVDSETKTKLNETEDKSWAVEELKGQAGGAEKQPIFIEIRDDEDTCMWCDDDEKPSLITNDSGSGEPGSELWQFTGNDEWFFRGNKLMLSSGMKKHLRELCGYAPPEIPFYVYQMNKSNLKRRGRMRLSAKYISRPLLSCLDKEVGFAHFEVDGQDRGTVRVQLNADGRASLTTGWENVVAAKDIKVGDICAFHFRICDGVLKLSVHVFHAVRHFVCVR